MIYYLAIS